MSLPLHQNTPTLTAIDPRGLAVRTVAYYRPTAQVELEVRISHQVFNASGFVVQQCGPRQWMARDSEKNACHVTVYNLGGQPIYSDSPDAGWRLTLLGGAGQWMHRWMVAALTVSATMTPRCGPWRCLNKRPMIHLSDV